MILLASYALCAIFQLTIVAVVTLLLFDCAILALALVAALSLLAVIAHQAVFGLADDPFFKNR